MAHIVFLLASTSSEPPSVPDWLPCLRPGQAPWEGLAWGLEQLGKQTQN